MTLAFISVVMPVFNGERTIRDAVQSVLDQTYGHFELLVIDDGSTDQTSNILRRFDDRRIVLKGDRIRRGLTARLNEGIDWAKGDVIARMDADDISFPERFEKQIIFLNSHPEIDLVGSRAIVFQGPATIVGLHPFAKDHATLCAKPWRGISLPHPTWMGRTAWFRRFRYAVPEVARAEDQDLLLRAYADSRFACLSDTLLAYRQGTFSLGKTMIARRHLLTAQLRHFAAKRDWKNFGLSCCAFLLKTFFDIVASLPGCDRLFFARMSEPVPPEVSRGFAKAFKSREVEL